MAYFTLISQHLKTASKPRRREKIGKGEQEKAKNEWRRKKTDFPFNFYITYIFILEIVCGEKKLLCS